MKRPEQVLQKSIVHWLRVVLLPDDAPFFTAINPVPGKSMAAAGLSKAMGMVAGVPDLLMVWRGRPIFFELKAGRGRESAAQEAVAERLAMLGAVCFVIRSIDEMREALRVLGIPTREIVRVPKLGVVA